MAEQLSKGRVFKTFADFEEILSSHCLESGYIFTKKNATSVAYANKAIKKEENFYKKEWVYKSVQFQCKHFGEYTPASGKPRQKMTDTFKTGCGAHLRLFASKKDDGLVITEVDLEHTLHALKGRETVVYPETRKLEEYQARELRAMIAMKLKPAECIKQVLNKYGIPLTARDIQNHKAKLQSSLDDDQLTAEALRDLMQSDSGSVADVLVDADNKSARVIFFQTTEMRSILRVYPSVLFIDGTYKINNRGMPLYTFMCVDGCNNGKVVAYAIVQDETSCTLRQLLNMFLKHNSIADKISSVVIDKDFSEMRAIRDVLPGAKIILCKFHVFQAIKRALKGFSLESKTRIMECVKTMVNSGREADYVESLNFLLSTEPVFSSYFVDHWDSIKESWAGFHVRTLTTFGNLTNNFVESHNQKIKLAVSNVTSIPNLISDLLHLQSVKQIASCLSKGKLRVKKKLAVSSCAFLSGEIDMLYRVCTPYAARMMKLEMEAAFSKAYIVDENSVMDPNGKLYHVSASSCDCFVNQCKGLLCSHIFALRHSLNCPLFTENDISPQHSLHVYVGDPVSTDHSHSSLHLTPSIRSTAVLTQAQKFWKAQVKTNELADILSSLGQDEFDCHLDMFCGITDAIKRGKSILWIEGDRAGSSAPSSSIHLDDASSVTEFPSNVDTPIGPPVVSSESSLIASQPISDVHTPIAPPVESSLIASQPISDVHTPIAPPVVSSESSLIASQPISDVHTPIAPPVVSSESSLIASQPISDVHTPIAPPVESSLIASQPISDVHTPIAPPVVSSESSLIASQPPPFAPEVDDSDDFVGGFKLPTQIKKRGRPKQTKSRVSKKRKLVEEVDTLAVLKGILNPEIVSLVTSGSILIDQTMLRDVEQIPGHVSFCRESLLSHYFTVSGWEHFLSMLCRLRGNC